MTAKFKLLAPGTDHKVRWTFPVGVPTDNGVHNQQFTAEFRVLKQSEVDERIGSPADILSGDEKPEINLLREVLIGWQGLTQEEVEGEVPFSEEVRDALLDLTYFRVAAVKAYFELLNGRRAKN